MLRLAHVLGRTTLFLLRSPLTLIVLLVWAGLGAFDSAIFCLTDASWFGSLGQSAAFNHQLASRALLFWGFLLPAVGAGFATMRIAAHPTPTSANHLLPPTLEWVQPYRERAARLGWLLIAISAYVLAHHLATHWFDAISLLAAPTRFPEVTGADFLVLRWPFLDTLLRAVWRFSLVLFAVAVLVGGLRALPAITSRHSQVPPKWTRLLQVLGAWLVLLRALGYGLQIPLTLRGDGAWSAIIMGVPTALVGLCLCATLFVALWRRLRFWRMVFGVVAALFLPTLLKLVLWPLAAVLPEPDSVRQWRQQATRIAWAQPLWPQPSQATVPLSQWPYWDEQHLLQWARVNCLRAPNQPNAPVVDWQVAGLQWRPEANPAMLAGQTVTSQDINTQHQTGSQNAIQWLPIDPTSVQIAKAGRPLQNAYYGLAGPPLFAEEPEITAGAPITNWGMTLAWAWRLRDISVLLDAVHARRLLVFRDVRETARRLAPFLRWDQSTLVADPETGRPTWEIIGYASSSNFPGVTTSEDDTLGNQNAAWPVALLRMDAISGTLSWQRFEGNRGHLSPALAWVLPSLKGATISEPRVFSALEASLWPQRSPAWMAFGDTFSSHLERSRQNPLDDLDWQKRLTLLDNSAQTILQEGTTKPTLAKFDSGIPLLWYQNGKLLAARPYFHNVKPQPGTIQISSEPNIALMGIAISDGTSTVANETLAEALEHWERINTPADQQKPRPLGEVAREALQAQQAASQAMNNSQWEKYGKAAKQTQDLLEELVQRTK